MSVNPLLTNYNAVGGGLFAPASGGGGGGGGGGNLIVSTLVAASGTPGTPQLTAAFNGQVQLNSKAVVSFGDTNSEIADVGIRFNAASTWDTYISNITGVAGGSGVLLFDGITQLSTSGAADLTISSINGAAPGGGGGGGTVPPNLQLSSLVVNNGDNAQITSIFIQGGSTIGATVGKAGLYLQKNNGNTILAFQTLYNESAEKFDLQVLGGGGGDFSGLFQFDNQTTTIQALSANLAISSINGAAPGGVAPRAGFALVPEASSSLAVNVGGAPAANGWWVVITPTADTGAIAYWANSASISSFNIDLSAGAPVGGLGFYWNAVPN